MEKDVNSVIYAVLSQLNPKRLEWDNIKHTNDPYLFLNDSELQAYVKLTRDCDYVNRGYLMFKVDCILEELD
jgi:hypothetical protein